MNIPTIGGARGIFEIFVPGTFLLFNIAAAVYLFPSTDDETRSLLIDSTSNSALVLVITISFGYLIGVLLRLLSPDYPDRGSSKLMQFSRRKQQGERRISQFYLSEHFPYIGWIGEACSKYLPDETLAFYTEVWSCKAQGGTKVFFNFCKVLISSNDERAANEIYAAESLTRYIAGMFYALSLSSGLLLITIAAKYLDSKRLVDGLIVLLVIYLLSIIEILRRFRSIRIKEVETVFAACYRNRELFEKAKPFIPE